LQYPKLGVTYALGLGLLPDSAGPALRTFRVADIWKHFLQVLSQGSPDRGLSM
jgi:hypothetical protein